MSTVRTSDHDSEGELGTIRRLIDRGDIAALVERVRSTNYGIINLLRDIERLKEDVARAADSRDVIEAWRRTDAILGRTLERTSAVHEVVLERSLRGYAEVDDVGVVVYANPAFLRLDAAIIGTRLADRFGPSGREIVESALVRGSTLRRLDLQVDGDGNGTPIPVSAEFGPVILDGELIGGYCILVDLRPYDHAASQTLDAAPFGAFRLDGHGRIVFANRWARAELGGVDAAALRGHTLAELLDGEGEPLSRALADGSAELDGVAQRVTLKPPRTPAGAHLQRADIPIMLSVFPEFDVAQSRVGSLAMFRSRAIDVARAKIRDACLQASDPLDVLPILLSEIRAFVPFTAATFGMFDCDRTHFRVLATEPRLEAAQSGYTPGATPRPRWLAVPEELRSWIDGEETWEPDLDAFWRRYPNASALRQSALVQELEAAGYKSFISMADRRQNARSVFLSLLSTERNSYGHAEHGRLRDLGVEQALDLIHEGLRRQRKERTRLLMQDLAAVKTHSHRELAKLLCSHVARGFGWQHVSIFKVNRLHRRFELLAQVDTTSGAFSVPETYSQPFEPECLSGMLGRTLEHGLQTLDDSRGAEGPSYIRLIDEASSALCKPITLDGTIAWILNAEAHDTHAFYGPDLETLDKLIEALQSTLDRMFRARLVHRALDLAEQGVLITDAEGRVRYASREAELMLGTSLEELWRLEHWSALLVGDDRESVRDQGMDGARTGRFQVGDGAFRRLKVHRKGFVGEEYDHELWILTDPFRTTEQVEMSYLMRTVGEVAQQSRLPLTIATYLLKRVTGAGVSDGILDLAARASQQIAKAEITYERLATGLRRQQRTSRRNPVALDALIWTMVAALPEVDRNRAIVTVPDERVAVEADGPQLTFMLRSLLFYLLRIASVDARVTIEVEQQSRGVWLALSLSERLEGSNGTLRLDDSVSQAEEAARLMAELAPDALRCIAEEHGELLTFVIEPPAPRFELLFLASPEG